MLEYIQAVCPPVTLAAGFPARYSPRKAFDTPTPEQLAGLHSEASVHSGLLGMLEADLQQAEELLVRRNSLFRVAAKRTYCLHQSQQDMSQPAMAMPLAVKVVALSSISDGQALLNLNRSAHVQLARAQTAFGASDRAIRALDEVWSDILSAAEADPELAAQACRVRAECLLACVEQAAVEKLEHLQEEAEGAMAEAITLLRDAAQGYQRVGCPSERVQSLAALAKAQHKLEDTAARDGTAKEWRQASSALSADLETAECAMMERLSKVEAICATASGRLAAMRSRM